MIPTKDKKLKPVIHLVVTVGCGFIIQLFPDKIGGSLSIIMRSAIANLSPSQEVSSRSNLVFFIDRGYLAIAKQQIGEITNLVQIMVQEGVKFLGTVRNTKSFPFELVSDGSDDNRVCNDRVIAQMSGNRTSFSAFQRSSIIKVTILRHGIGKVRAARIGTNIPELLGLSKWVYETKNSNDRIINPTLSPLLQEVNMSSLSLSEKVSHAWDLFYCSVTQVTAKQRTTDWFLARMFSFTSTSLYKVISENATRSYITEDIVSDFLATQQVMSLNVQDESANSLSQQEATSRRGDRTSITYWINNKSKPQLMQLLNEKGIDCTEQMNKRQLAELLVAHINENANTSSNTDPLDSINQTTAQIQFLRHMTPIWFMRPFHVICGGHIEQGSENEDQVLSVLPKYVKNLSGGLYEIGVHKDFGLISHRLERCITSSPDGVVALFKKNANNQLDFISLTVIEVKTKTSTATVDALQSRIQAIGSGFVECNAGSSQFRIYIPEPEYRAQIVQHATALSLNKVLMVYSTVGALPRLVIIVNFSASQREVVKSFQVQLVNKYMKFVHDSEDNNGINEFPSLGNDYCEYYGYAAEHHTVELWIRIWRAHWKDVQVNGVPPSCRRLLDSTTSMWNKCMGGVDTVRKVVKGVKARRGSDCGPGSIFWYTIFDYLLYNAFRIYQFAKLEEKIRNNSIGNFRQLLKAKQRYNFKAYLYSLSNKDFLEVKVFRNIFQVYAK